ncbi:hypothetical protein Lal_00020989 [Lupinus albus]|nr:hypothetical protein Lal_00020989 [Lupinus albus]
MTIACFLSSAAIIAIGAHLSYVNVEPQRARTLARDDFVRETLKKKHGYIPQCKPGACLAMIPHSKPRSRLTMIYSKRL